MPNNVIMLTITVVFVWILAYVATKLLGSVSLVGKADSKMRVIESISVSYQKSISLVRVGKKNVLIGISKDKLTFLTELSDDDLDIDKDTDLYDSSLDSNFKPFEKYLNQLLPKNKNR